MEEKTKIELLKEKIAELKRRKEAKNVEPWDISYENKPRRGLLAGTAVALVAVSLATALVGNEMAIDHASEVCLASRALGVFSEQAAINHQISGIKSDYKDCEDLSVAYERGYYVAPEGYCLEDDCAVKYVKPIEVVTYSVPAGYVLQGTIGVRTLSDGTVETINATKNVQYCLPDGGTLTTDSNGNVIGVIKVQASYVDEPTIVTQADEEQYTLKLK